MEPVGLTVQMAPQEEMEHLERLDSMVDQVPLDYKAPRAKGAQLELKVAKDPQEMKVLEDSQALKGVQVTRA